MRGDTARFPAARWHQDEDQFGYKSHSDFVWKRFVSQETGEDEEDENSLALIDQSLSGILESKGEEWNRCSLSIGSVK